MTNIHSAGENLGTVQGEAICLPDSVKLAVNLIWLSIALSFLSLLFEVFVNPDFMPNISARIASFSFTLLFFCFLIAMIKKGKNWARIIFAIGAILAAILFLISLSAASQLGMTIWQVVQGIINNSLSIFIVYTLFRQNSTEWFASAANT